MDLVIWAKTEFVGWHRWKDAPPHRAYLGNVHRHLFKVVVTVQVTHDDRQVEFHDLKDMVDGIIAKQLFPYTRQSKESCYSCEQMAAIIAVALQKEEIFVETVSVSEDDECGAMIRNLKQ